MKTLFLHLSTALLLIASGLLQAAPTTEIVIAVSDAEARTVLEKSPLDWRRYEEYSWHSNGRIRIVRIDSDALHEATGKITFTPFAGVPPIQINAGKIDTSETIWSGSRVNSLMSQALVDEQLATSAQLTDYHIRDRMRSAVRAKTHVELKLYRFYVDPGTGDFLLHPGNTHFFTINPKTGETFHKSAPDDCVRQEVPLEKPAFSGDAGAVFGASGTDSGTHPRFSADATNTDIVNWMHCNATAETGDPLAGVITYMGFPAVPPLPDNVQRIYGVNGSISDDNSGRLGSGGRTYTIKRLMHSPGYVMIYEWDRSRNYKVYLDPPFDTTAAHDKLPEVVRSKDLIEDFNRHMHTVDARIAASGQGGGK